MIEDIGIEPLSGAFDVAEVEAYLEGLPLVAHDPHDAHGFIAFYARDLLDEAVEERKAHADRLPAGAILIDVRSHRIGIHARTAAVETPRHFVEWLRGRYQVRFFDDDYGGEVADVGGALEQLFGAVEPPAIAKYDEHGFEIINDPVGSAKALIEALLSPTQGRAWRAQLAQRPSGGPIDLGPTLRATTSGAEWRIERTDRGEGLVMSVEQISALLDQAVLFRNNYRWESFPRGATLDNAQFEIEDELFGSADRGLYRARDAAGGRTALVSLSTRQREPVATLVQRFGYEVSGVAALLHIGPLATDGEARYDGLVEVEPNGMRSAELAPVDAKTAAARGLAVGEIVAAAHAKAIVLGGLRPELVFMDGDRVVGVAPRCAVFHASMTKPDYGVPMCFPHVYFSPEVLAHPQAPMGRDTDVFALAAMIAFWHTGDHPFTGEYSTNLMAVVARQRTAWRGDANLGAIVESGLKPAASRASLEQLLGALRSFSDDR